MKKKDQGKKPWDYEAPKIDFQEKCVRCGHIRLDHVFSEGPCRGKIPCKIKCEKFAAPGCKHEKITTESEVQFIPDIDRWMLDVRVKCSDCGQEFVFLGMNHGMSYEHPMIGVFGLEARLPMYPFRQDPPPLPLNGPNGFTVKTIKP